MERGEETGGERGEGKGDGREGGRGGGRWSTLAFFTGGGDIRPSPVWM